MCAQNDARRNLPGVDKLLERSELRAYRDRIATPHLTRLVREQLDSAREALARGKEAPDGEQLALRIVREIERRLNSGPRRVINATGVILHTGLGRAPLSAAAIAAVADTARYCDLEFDLESGERGDRQSHVESLLAWITGADAALMVNNNAAALFLVLNSLAARREVIVSRGQLIEIGGSFRLPEIMARAGAKLIEVGTTNRTRISDFAAAVSDKTAMLLRAYPSNFRVEGFAESVEVADLATLAHSRGALCVDDLGGGLLWDWAKLGMPTEPHVAQSLSAGADLVLVSGDKVLGGPQAGLILGRKELVAKLKKSPMARVLRPGKLEVAALSATLLSFLHPDRPAREVPVWSMFAEMPETTRTRADRLLSLVKGGDWAQIEVCESPAQAGSGTLPATPLPSFALALNPARQSAARFARGLRTARTPVITVVQNDTVLVNLRTVSDSELTELAETILSVADKKA